MFEFLFDEWQRVWILKLKFYFINNSGELLGSNFFNFRRIRRWKIRANEDWENKLNEYYDLFFSFFVSIDVKLSLLENVLAYFDESIKQLF